MTNHVMKSGSILYEHDKDTVKTLDIVAKGVIRATRDYCTIDLPAGSIIGIGETPNSPYTFTYEAGEEDVSLFSYPYESEASLVALFKANPKLLGMLVAGCIRFAKNLQNATVDTMSMARTEYAAVSAAQEDYEKLAISVGAKVREFRDLSWISEPSMLDTARGWHRDFVDDLFTYEAKFKKDFFPIPSIGLGIGLTIHSYAQESKAFISSIFDYLDSLRRNSEEFMTEYRNLKNRSVPGSAKDSVGESMDDSVHHCLDAIAAFARPSSELLDHFRKSLDRFMRHKDRYGSDDDIRRLRRELAADFYELYTACFIATIGQTWEGIPIGVRMFLLFGFVDEQLAGEENTAKLSSITENFAPDLHCRVVTIVEWLMLIYRGKVMPSKNEFDLDYPNYLISLKRNGDITDAQANQLLNSAVDKLKFEIKNFFLSANRLTFGRITTFVPVFDRDNVAKPLEMAYLNRKNVSEQIDRLRDIDFKAFCRQGVFSDPANGITTFFTTDEVLPYVILMPNVGSRASLWQEIDAKKRSTPARMVVSIFHTENVEDTFIRLVGEFRWEMCKTEQGVHWNDISDPSLTSMYCDYLQFYRKNSSLSAEIKEKISIALKNNSNNFKKVFVEDYFIYMKYESQGALRLNRTARTILFSCCPFTKEIRDKIAENPQFSPCIKQHDMEVAKQKKNIENLAVKLQKKDIPLPPTIRQQLEFLER